MIYKLLIRLSTLICFLSLRGTTIVHDNMAYLRYIYNQPPTSWPKPFIAPNVDWQELQAISNSPSQLSPQALLGKRLFFESHLSSDKTISCASCHHPTQGFTDKRRVSIGVEGRQRKRNSISLMHLQINQPQYFWDGRAHSLIQQVLMPITDPSEMNLSLEDLPRILSKVGYTEVFQQTFGENITVKNIAIALTAYLQSLSPSPTRFGLFLQGDKYALSDAELRGLHLFRTKARCMNCHSGIMMTDGLMHNLNQTLYNRPWQDLGQYAITGNPADWGKFKTPSLRNLQKTKPWFHHGLFINLRGIIAMYNLGMPIRPPSNAPQIMRKYLVDPLIIPLHLYPQEQQDLVKFLETL